MSGSLPIKTLIPAAALLGLSVVREVSLWGSFAIGIASLVFLPWSIYSIFRIVTKPAERQGRVIRLAIWTAVLVLAFGVRAHWDTSARKDASAAAASIQAHRARTGGYPKSLGEVGLDATALQKQISLSYRSGEGQVALFYSQPSMPTIAHHYNFETNSWGRRD